MKKYKNLSIAAVGLVALAGCFANTSVDPAAHTLSSPNSGDSGIGAKAPGDTGKVPEGTPTEPSDENQKVLLQVTVINNLGDGEENCAAADQTLSFSMKDEKAKTAICKNSKVEVFAVSDAGAVVFHAVDRETGKELASSADSKANVYEIGKTHTPVNYNPENPDGFTYIIATETNEAAASRVHELNSLSTKRAQLKRYKAKVEEKGGVVSAAVEEKIAELDRKIGELSPGSKKPE
jgi:hypothetical protein